MSSTTSATKRQRISRSGLESLPDDTLLNIATYLSHTTRALLSTALTAPSSSYDLGGHNENDKELMARDIEQIVRNHGWQSSGSESLSDILSSAIAAGQLTKINKTPQLCGGTLSKASKIVLMIHIIRNINIVVEMYVDTNTRNYGMSSISWISMKVYV